MLPQPHLVEARFLTGAMPNEKRRPKSRSNTNLPELDCAGLAGEWDQAEDVRSRLREGDSFIHPEATRDDVQGCCRNATLLLPILTRMATIEGRSLPPIDPLREQIEELLSKNKRGGAPEEIDTVVKASWRLKKMLGFVKMKVRREEVSTVTWLNLHISAIKLCHQIIFFSTKRSHVFKCVQC